MSDNIPFDIQMEIIKKVPDVKSLIRFRSVSKPWKSFIDSSEFITGYGARDTQPHRLLLRYNKAGEKYVTFVDAENDNLTQQDFAPNVPNLVNYSKVIGSSYGLWCLYGYNSSEKTEMVVIWNPSIRKSVGIMLPCTNTFVKIPYFGFGVCPSTYDPTIVGISKYDTWQVENFTLSSKTWKKSSNVPRESITVRMSSQVAIDRFIFWAAFNQYKRLILSFDLITQEFKEVNLPDSLDNSLTFSISKLNESLVVSAYTNDVNGRVYGVWMMGEEGGSVTSFTKLFNINTPDSLIRRLLGFTMSHEPIMETEKYNGVLVFAKVEVYKPCSEHINDLRINGDDGSFFICPYTETLLLVDHPDCCILSGDS